MVNWQVTATTLYCDAVGEEVTVLVYKDWTLKCTGCDQYGNLAKGAGVAKKQQQSGHEPRCPGPECSRTVGYRDKLMAEEESGR
jgi:hypothetical protein